MFVLLESSHKGFIEHLGHRLSRNGINCHVLTTGCADDGDLHFVLRVTLYTDMEHARHLLYRDPLFALWIDRQFAPHLQALRAEPRHQLWRWLTSPLALRISVVAVLMLVIGSLIELIVR
ncbi:MAG: hypothetical protein KJ884_16045 [Gammaproteobacteria bacterium]|nr:hypothetical protein [Gammaproteobacteria bacterium]MBU1490062.1 hypothetical protein [Gammaproteobacteria bacterium]MBU2066644.1 hypothetical protein [Gammaproteobacteria bacterium]MBU2138797.1 hypothetical protein [Gammaproteobacteria bacterium]MBU2216140.1 hypothetical protein [Gammaproteobacteria bacterium]